MFDEEEVKDIRCQGIVTEELDDNETNDDRDFSQKLKGFDCAYGLHWWKCGKANDSSFQENLMNLV